MGAGFRQSLDILSELIPLERIEIPSGTQVFDWTVPPEWNIEDAYVENEGGERVIDFRRSNLHVLGYSVPVDRTLTLAELQPHLYSLPEMPDAIPYLTSYYQERWGFCLTERQRQALPEGRYRAVIRSRLEPGNLVLAHHVLPATEPGPAREILISTYLCHPSLANNELSGPLVTAFLYRALARLPRRRFTYRFAVVPETIGSIAYLSRFGEHLKQNLHAGLVATCVGDANRITYKRSRRGDAVIDRMAEHELKMHGKPFEAIDFFPSGSDERQYCSPGFDLPVGSLMRSMYGTYPEYHTSLDDKGFVSFAAMEESVALYLRVLTGLEANLTHRALVAHGEPQLGKRGLYPTLGSQKQSTDFVDRMMWIINLSDGRHDLLAIAAKARCSIHDLVPIVEKLIASGVLSVGEP
jgi:aminopeptidase-like protein